MYFIDNSVDREIVAWRQGGLAEREEHLRLHMVTTPDAIKVTLACLAALVFVIVPHVTFDEVLVASRPK